MHKLMYKFEDGTVVGTLAEAKAKKEETGMNWKETFEFVPLPSKFVQDGVDWDKVWKVRSIPGLKQIDTGNLAAKGYYRTTAEELKRREDAHKKYILEAQNKLAAKKAEDTKE